MKYILFVLLAINTIPANAMMDVIQNKLRETPAMEQTCDDRMFYYSQIITELEEIPRRLRTDAVNMKLDHFYDEFEDWINYCEGNENSAESQ